MNIKHLTSALITIVSLSFFAVTGCSSDVDATTDEIDMDEGGDDQYGDDDFDTQQEALSTTTLQCTGKAFAKKIKVHTGVISSTLIDKDGAYDIRSYCKAEINKRRTQVHKSYNNLQLNPYHHALTDKVLPEFTLATVAKDNLDKEVEYCRAVADAELGTHSAYDFPMPGSGAAFCPILSSTTDVRGAVQNCLNGIEREPGYGAHNGGLIWDTTRAVSCALGVITVNGEQKRGITIAWGTPNPNADQPNGARCKADSSCSSGVCAGEKASDKRCKGPTGSACRTTKIKDCVAHPEDPSLCVPRGFECQSGVCKANGTCQ